MRLREPSARVVQRARVKQAVAEVFKVFKERYGAPRLPGCADGFVFEKGARLDTGQNNDQQTGCYLIDELFANQQRW